MAWIYVAIAGIAEVFGLIAMRQSEGFTKKKPLLFLIPIGIASFYFLSLSLKELPIGTAYAIWTGIGAVGGVAVGILLYKEKTSAKQLIFLGMVIVGLLGIRLAGVH